MTRAGWSRRAELSEMQPVSYHVYDNHELGLNETLHGR
jgi:hypothetical protein